MKNLNESASRSQINAIADGLSGTAQITQHTYGKYVAFAIFISWHFCLWFTPQAFWHIPLLASTITIAWLVYLFASAGSLAALYFLTRAYPKVQELTCLNYCCPFLLCVLTLALTIIPESVNNLWMTCGICIALGFSDSILWLLWAKHYSQLQVQFKVSHIGIVFSLTLFCTMLVANLIPKVLAPWFISLLPMISSWELFRTRKIAVNHASIYHSNKAIQQSVKTVGTVCALSFIAAAACYYLVAIIPWEDLPTQMNTFAYGIMAGALLIVVIVGIERIFHAEDRISASFPWLLILLVVAFAFFLTDPSYYLTAFLLALAVFSAMEVLLIAYFGRLTINGLVSPLLAFTLSCVSIRTGIGVGNSIALLFEMNPPIAEAYTSEVGLVFICLIMMILVPLVRQEYLIEHLVTPIAKDVTLEQVCQDLAIEHRLSPKEYEVLVLIVRGRTAEEAAEYLSISVHTVNTHIRHIYEKTGIHRRNDLIRYVNRSQDALQNQD